MKKILRNLMIPTSKMAFRLWSASTPRVLIREEQMSRQVSLPWLNTPLDVSFGHSKKNQSGLQIDYRKSGARSLLASCRPKDIHANFPGATHGGVVSCALDEVMGQVVFTETGGLAISLEATIEWLASTPIEKETKILAQIRRSWGRMHWVVAELRSENDQVYARSRGLYFQPPAKVMAKILKLNNLPSEAQSWFK